MGIQRRPDNLGAGGRCDGFTLDHAIAVDLPNVVEFLTLEVWPDGKKRVPGSVLVVCNDGYWKAWLHDQDARMSAWVSAESMQALWERVDAILGGAAHEWRRDREGGGKRK